MLRRLFGRAGWIFFLLLLCTCNVYRPLDSAGNDSAYKEEVIHCYAINDYECAVANYLKMSDGNDKTQSLCVGYLNQAGLTLSTLLNVITKADATMLGQLATTLLPWSSARGTAADGAATQCNNLATAYAGSTGTAKDTSVLLSTVAYFLKCANRLSHAHAFGDSSDPASATCLTKTYSPSSSSVLQVDVDGMCDQDVKDCRDSLALVAGSSALSTSGLSSLATAFDFIPADLKDSGTLVGAARTALKTVVASSR
ncbi:MAG: hypothetical protein HYR96_07270 [Deltaproteobacteria bacterium]|nr:hypothetical protein [Deltaproteobacteria bacterium]MBI3295141.1 hypothetical protein [Deltaproteobacteria bacterium]